ncbi:MAG: aldehyde ferredoxin oxidoreductase C-terminal domain-containing protein [Chloroflexota bacterium]
MGDLLAEGTKRAAERIGGEAVKAVLAVKGSELPMHEPRGKFTVGLSYAVAVMGADHLQAMHDPVYERRGPGLDQLKVLGLYEPLPSRSLSWQKVRAMAYLNLWASVVNTLDLCWLVATNAPVALLTIGDVVKVVNGVTGWDMSLWELMKAGERSLNMARAFAGRRGLSAADDTLPDRFFEPLPSGPLAGAALDRDEFAAALRGYYEMRGWSVETGMPERHKLEELGIADLVLAD